MGVEKGTGDVAVLLADAKRERGKMTIKSSCCSLHPRRSVTGALVLFSSSSLRAVF